jgi:hypothetical protein
VISSDPSRVSLPQWQREFDAFVASRMRTPFCWGQHDCCLFAADAVKAITGIDRAAPWRGTYFTELQAARVLKDLGGLAALASQAGDERPPLSAQLGDIGLVFDGSRELLGVCVGPNWLVPGTYGLAALPLRAGRRAWSVHRG